MKKTLEHLVYRLRRRAAQYVTMGRGNTKSSEDTIAHALNEVADCIQEVLTTAQGESNEPKS